MRRVISLAAALAACGDPGSVPKLPDGRLTFDSNLVDGDSSCHTGITLKSTNEGHVGGSGGGKGNALLCDDMFGERIVGVAVQMSNQATVNGGRSAQGLRIGCATVTIEPNGTATVGAITTHDVSGTGQFNWSPSTWTALQQCAPGSVLTGLLAHTGTNNDLFVDVSIICSQLAFDATPSNPQTIHIVNSLTAPTNPKQAQCAGGEVVSELGVWDGAGFDAADLFCSPSVCR
jgi:hypothetical protein